MLWSARQNASRCRISVAPALSQDRFRGLRCVHTQLLNEKLTQDDLTDLALLRLDLMSIIQVDSETGLPNSVYSAHLLPTTADELNVGSAAVAV